jgi:D-sedoheptulose 7-phosphate isomerase
MSSHSQKYFEHAARIALAIDHEAVERIVDALATLRERGGRLFLLGVGGSAANCSHAVNDFRKLNGIEAYSATDNIAELTARTNDEGWETVFRSWLGTSHSGSEDAVFILSVGGGDMERNISPNLVAAIDEAKRRGTKVFGIVGREQSYTKLNGDEVIVVPIFDPGQLTPQAEAFQAVIWHAIVSHPKLLQRANKWEGVTAAAAREQ